MTKLSDKEQSILIDKNLKFLGSEDISIVEKLDYIIKYFPKHIPEKPVDRGRLVNWWILARGDFIDQLAYPINNDLKDFSYLMKTTNPNTFRLKGNKIKILSNSKFYDIETYIGKSWISSDVSKVNFWKVKIKSVNQNKFNMKSFWNIEKYCLNFIVEKEWLGNDYKPYNQLIDKPDFLIQEKENFPRLTKTTDEDLVLFFKNYFSCNSSLEI